MAEPLKPEEEAAARAVAAHVGGEVWEHSAVASLVARLLATLDAERAASQGDPPADAYHGHDSFYEDCEECSASQGDEGLLLAKYPKRAFATEAGDRLLAMNAGRDSAVVQWLTNDIRAIEQEEYDKIRAALAEEEKRA